MQQKTDRLKTRKKKKGISKMGSKKKISKKVTKQSKAKPANKYVIVRTYAMGVFAGELQPESTETMKVLKYARRIWYWAGAASLSQLATEGTSKPSECKFPCVVDRVELTSPQGFEVLDVTEMGRKSIEAVPIWKA